jgi:F420-non-reducing hydrogenase small subunit
MAKPKIGFYWCAGCGGCDETVVDLANDLLKVVEAVDIVFWPVAMDFKQSDVEAMADGEIAATLINGAIRNDEQEYMAKLLRRKSRLIIANGSCAHLGGVVGLANFSTKQDILNRVFKEIPTVNNPAGILPQTETHEYGRDLELPNFHDAAKPLNRVIDVDYYLPGCPTPPEYIKNAIEAVVANELPPKGTVFGQKKALCAFCSRAASKPDKIKIKRFKRLYETEWDSTKCFLDQDIICLGPVTRGDCGQRCINANMPCRGCFGPVDNVVDYGAKAISFLTSIIDSNDPEELEKIADSIPDPGGLFYRYALADLLKKQTGTEKK